MVSKSRFGKVAAFGLAAGVIAVAGLGVGTVSADDGRAAGGAPAQERRLDVRPSGPAQGQGQQQIVRVRPGAPGQAGPNANRPGVQLPGRPGQAPGAAMQNQESARARGIVTAAAEVLAMQPASVVAGLEQGQSLTQVAAAQGLSREFFLTELIDQIEKDIADGQRFGIPASANLEVQVAGAIDEPGLARNVSNLF